MKIVSTTNDRYEQYRGRQFSNNKKGSGEFTDSFAEELKKSRELIDKIQEPRK